MSILRGSEAPRGPVSESVDQSPDRFDWKQPFSALGHVPAVGGLVSTGGPLLSGFSLTTVAVLLTYGGAELPLREWAIASFVLAALSLVMSIQWNGEGVQYFVKPSERIEWLPQIETDKSLRSKIQKQHRLELEKAERFAAKAATCYNFGILFFLVGFMLLLWPDEWQVARLLAFALRP